MLKINQKVLLIVFLLCLSLISMAQLKITGTVFDTSNLGLPGVNIVVKGTTTGTITDLNGNFTILANNKSDVLVFSMIGYISQEILINDNSEINIILQEDLKQLDEVVVVGYGTVKKSDVTGAVSSVKSEELVQTATISVQQAMQGRASGVMITAESGEPGAGMKVRVRGTGTINNSNPLYVVDGFPTGSISYLSPTDIESIDILKDASATAIYGNRGANGVVLISTKKGKKAKTTVNLNVYSGIQNIAKKIEVLDATQYSKAKIEAYKNAGDDLQVTNPSKYDVFQYVIDNNLKGTDWQNAILQQGAIKNYNLSISGGSDHYKYYLSGTYDKTDGIIRNSWNERYFFRIANQVSINDNVGVDVNLAYSHNQKTNYDYNDYSSPLVLALLAVPVTPIYDAENITPLNPEGYSYAHYNARSNPVAAIDRMNNGLNKSDAFIANLALNIQFFEGLTFTSKFGGNLSHGGNRSYNPTYYIGAKDEHNSEATLYESFDKNINWTWSNFLSYNKEFEKQSISVMAGQEMSYFFWMGSNHTVYGVPSDPNLRYVSTASGITYPTVGGYVGESALLSYFARANYVYNDKYLATITIRRDASSKIAEKYRWGTFPSFSLAWKLSEEGFMQSIRSISFLKLRAGMGITGNEGSISDPYSLYATVNENIWMVSPNKTKIPGAIQTTTPNERLQWETTIQYNAGLDFGFFDNQITGTMEYFIRNTEDMIVDNNPPLFNGMYAARFNFGSMQNKGFEFSMTYKNSINNLNYEIGGNITLLDKPIVTRLATPDYVYNNGSAGKIGGITRVEEGMEFAFFRGYKTDGLLTQEDIDNTWAVVEKANGRIDTVYTYEDFRVGDPKLIDINGDGQFKDADDKVNLGSANPDFFYGLNLGLEYKGFDLKCFIQGVGGIELVNGITSWLDTPNQGDDNLSTRVLDSYGFDGNTETNMPILVQGNPFFHTYFCDFYVQDASYLRIKNIQLGYNLPQQWLKPVKLSNCRIYVSGDNLFTFTKYNGFDPEVGRSNGGSMAQGIDMATYPVAKKILFGVNLSF